MPLLQVRNLKTYYQTARGYVKAVDGVNFQIGEGEVFGLAGESGCGKTTVALSIIRLLPPGGRIIDGEIMFNDKNILAMSEEDIRKIRWKKIAIVFQGAMNALNPVMKVGDQIVEAITTHEDVSKEEAWRRAEKLLEMVGIEPSRAKDYPHEFSGGMKQRVMIAMALACNPQLLIADEPATALDVIVQAQILKLMRDLQRKMNLSMMLITHDLSIIAETCNKVAIMYAGKIVEYADTKRIFREPQHPYTRGLIGAFPSIKGPRRKLISIPGTPPDLLNPPSGCRFHPRCPYTNNKCKSIEPEIKDLGGGHYVACHMPW
ncbi:MAG: ABC transporter ATP-binding protein [archaeon YNP-LCB-003-016]|jgi:peptide/nickel transport system ATP-binding protein|uniref:ABC transporter ATP-binding protein n=1 Tax=Candidatus Culexarchaeum yellowstonense TaxID=2928963 RepID=UPI0026EA7CBD|nr:ABC transporter ATP-binding protein [Candidatus Culexarchaeum yellowstonense]MCR6692272.1 ABC transporter ATP-binding protein [Candidatus Culexarchaeum yellowstonense]